MPVGVFRRRSMPHLWDYPRRLAYFARGVLHGVVAEPDWLFCAPCAVPTCNRAHTPPAMRRQSLVGERCFQRIAVHNVSDLGLNKCLFVKLAAFRISAGQ